MPLSNLAYSDVRRENRDEVHHRTRGQTADGGTIQLLLVNTSTGGFMARCDASLQPGDTIEVTLPRLGQRSAVVRWALGGRIGCEYGTAIPLASYYELLAALLRQQ
ncbi:hypothetical protein SAMN06297144_2125 [Sphingomonas guangdongensis]|uniref:PilZ domain-containing protein n=1 Tax=Sphingomonas guangdongensis TaxID=1141890 RepID=A0A285QYF6_9SPHN|nr:PilZ domain-containing protein [Sphingomonas guangdongensis]SOB87005.1 hypothetical protein SAMN06297144_2125 [Sphingomonas guangdongensis]